MKHLALSKLIKRPVLVLARVLLVLMLPGSLFGSTESLLDSNREEDQSAVYSIKIEYLQLKDAIKKIANETGHYFVFEDKDLVGAPVVNKEFVSTSVENIVKECVGKSDLTYKIADKVIYITKKATPIVEKKIASVVLQEEQQQRREVSGVVRDINRNSLPGLYITVKEIQSLSAVTDGKGGYKISLPQDNNNYTLVFSFMGMQTQEITVDGRSVIDVLMRDQEILLDEIVVVGYGVARKKDIAGSIENISASEIAKTNNASFQKAIQGRLAGVQITSTSGLPGSSFSVNIRGRGSINAGTQPLYIIDGVQIVNGAQTTNVLANADVMGGLNPDDIESITVLKDGASASIYGAQAANGVVIITTKSGSAQKTTLSVNASTGVQQLVREVPVLNGQEWAQYALLQYSNYDKLYGTNEYQKYLNLFKGFEWGDDGYSKAPTTNWYDQIFRQAVVQNYQLSMSGGSDKTSVYFSAGYNKTDGIIKHTGFDRISGRLNVSHKIKDWVKFSSNTAFSSTKHIQASTTAAANPSRTAMMLLPGVGPRDKDGNYYRDLPYGYYQYNIPQMLELNEYTGKTYNFTSANSLTFDLAPGLQFKSSYNLDFTWMFEHQYSDPRTRLGNRSNGVITASAADIVNFQSEQVLTYNKTFNSIHRFNAVGGFSYTNYQYHMQSGESNGVANPDLRLLSSGAIPVSANESYSEWKLAGFFTRVSYTLKDKYILSGTVRYDGSSRFGRENLWGTFPSISAAWKINEESFMKDVKWINDLRLRASYGITGNSSIGNYVSHRLYSGSVSYNSIPGIVQSTIGNRQLTWEKKHSKNLGLSVGMFDSRITLNIDGYIDDTKDLLYSRVIPQTTGFTSIPSNMGGVRNEGVDIHINTLNVTGKEFEWETAFNLSFNNNYITELQDGLDELGSYKVGKGITQSYVYKWAGVNTSDGRPMYYDQDGYITYNPTPDDRYWIKGTDPTLYGGMENTFRWKGLSFSFFLQFQRGAAKYWSDKTVLIGQAADNNLLKDIYNNYWKAPGDVTWVPLPMLNGSYPGNPMKYDANVDPGMSLIFESTNFIKLKNINLSYDLPKKLVNKLKLEDVQIYGTAYNIWTSTPYQGYDPESIGNDRGLYPQSKSYSIGIKVNF